MRLCAWPRARWGGLHGGRRPHACMAAHARAHTRTWGTPCWSLSSTPMAEGVMPLRANLQICSFTSAMVALHQLGAERL